MKTKREEGCAIILPLDIWTVVASILAFPCSCQAAPQASLLLKLFSLSKAINRSSLPVLRKLVHECSNLTYAFQLVNERVDFFTFLHDLVQPARLRRLVDDGENIGKISLALSIMQLVELRIRYRHFSLRPINEDSEIKGMVIIGENGKAVYAWKSLLLKTHWDDEGPVTIASRVRGGIEARQGDRWVPLLKSDLRKRCFIPQTLRLKDVEMAYMMREKSIIQYKRVQKLLNKVL
jgi:hypothetical protein